MHVIFVNYVYDSNFSTPYQLIDAYFELVGWVKGLISAGVQVSVFQRFHYDEIVRIKEAEYHFISDNLSPHIRRLQVPVRLHHEISKFIRKFSLDSDGIILHVNGLLFPLQVLHLRLSVSSRIGIVLQHHAEHPKDGIRGFIQGIGLRSANGFLFSTEEHSNEWVGAGMIHRKHYIGEIMEISSSLCYEERSKARRKTGFTGHPILFWTGNLNENKDPITILKGLKRILEVEPETRLYMAYRNDDLISEVREYIHSDENLIRAVDLLGEIPYTEIGSFYNSADFFVQGSHREGSGIALADALACGVIPVVTDIPSFRVMTDNGRIGALWPVGDSQGFIDAFLSIVHNPIDQMSFAARKHFENTLSFEKLGDQAANFYKKVIERNILVNS